MDSSYRNQEEIDLVKEMHEKCRFADERSANNEDRHEADSNNEDFFDSNYSQQLPTENGRISGGSRESAFSSGLASDESSQPDSYNNSLSGRSSTNRDSQFDELKLINTSPNLAPEVTQALELVESVRVKFLDSLKDNPAELYDSLDVAELKKPLIAETSKQEQSLTFRLIERFLDFRKISSSSHSNENNPEKRLAKEIDTAVEKLHDLLKFRRQYQLSSVSADQFTREFHILSGAFTFGHDRNNLPVLYLRASVHRKWSPKLDDTFRRWVAWQMNELTKSNHGARVNKTVSLSGLEKDGSFGICFDCLHVSYSCLDMDFLRFLVRVLVSYYPTYCRYALCVDLPWLFRSVWKLVRSWLPQDAQSTVLLITSKELLEFIDEDQIPNSIKVNDLKASEKPIKNRHYLPENFDSLKDIDQLAKELNVGANEVKQFKAHVAKVRKDYELAGAL